MAEMQTITDMLIEGKEFQIPHLVYKGFDAKYRKSHLTETLDSLRGLKVPSFLEALTTGGDWIRHPVVFYHGPSRNPAQFLIIFLENGTYRMIPNGNFNTKGIYLEAESKVLTSPELERHIPRHIKTFKPDYR